MGGAYRPGGGGAGGASSVTISQITDAGAVGADVLAATTGAEAQAAIGVSGDTLLAVGTALHHWRCSDTTSPFPDIGSGTAAALAYVAGTREYARPGLYRAFSATLHRSPSNTHGMEATITGVASGADLTFGLTVANESRLLSPPAGEGRFIALLHSGAASGSNHGILILTNSSGQIYLNIPAGTGGTDTAGVTIDWSMPHRIDVTRNGTTGDLVLYVDGIARITQTIAGTMDALTKVSLGCPSSGYGVNGCELLCADVSVHVAVLTPAQILARADACRRLF